MNGLEIFAFTTKVVPPLVRAILEKAGLTLDQIDLVIPHQANKTLLEHLRKSVGIPREKFFVSMAHCGNTVSASIPIALSDAVTQNRVQPGTRILLAGFGVGYSWGATILTWRGSS